MLKTIIFFAAAIVGTFADVAVTPPPPLSKPIRCGEIPTNIYSCLGNPKIVKPDISAKCTKSVSECEKIKCVFSKAGWLRGESVDRMKVSAHLEEFAKQHPEWAPAVQATKASCLSHDLPAQGVFLNCPAYDVLHCALSTFFRNAQPSQWSPAPECVPPRQFAAACPVCPADCFAVQVPYGSCTACSLLPRTP